LTAFLYRLRGELIALWCLAVVWAAWPLAAPGGGPATLAPVALGLFLRLWARRHAGSHTRGRTMVAPYRATGGPYRFLPHPLYTANLLVIAGLAWRLWGNRPIALAASLTGPLLLYTVLARSESLLLRRSNAAPREAPLDARTGRWGSEWASVAPPLLAWILAGW